MGEAPARPGVAGAHTSSLWLSLGGKAPASLLCFVQDVELVCSVAEAVLGEEQDVVLGQVGPLDPLLKDTQG